MSPISYIGVFAFFRQKKKAQNTLICLCILSIYKFFLITWRQTEFDNTPSRFTIIQNHHIQSNFIRRILPISYIGTIVFVMFWQKRKYRTPQAVYGYPVHKVYLTKVSDFWIFKVNIYIYILLRDLVLHNIIMVIRK